MLVLIKRLLIAQTVAFNLKCSINFKIQFDINPRVNNITTNK